MGKVALSKDDSYILLKKSILTNNYICNEELNSDTVVDTLIRIIDEVELNDKTINIIAHYAIRYSEEVLAYLIEKVDDDTKISIINKVEKDCRYYSINNCLHAKRFIDKYNKNIKIKPEKQQEYNKSIRNLLETIFKNSITYAPANEQLRLSPSQLIIVFLKYQDDMKKLKMLIEEALYPSIKEHVPSSEYIRDIAVAYGTIYSDYKNVDLIDFVHYFTEKFYEKKLIQCCNNPNAPVMNYELVYNDENVRIYYVYELNGLYIEQIEANIYNKKVYLYPDETSKGTRIIVRKTNISPSDLYNEYKEKEKIESVKRYDWPSFDSDSFIDLSCDQSLTTQEEKYKRTKKIIESSVTLKLLIDIDEKTYKKESNK